MMNEPRVVWGKDGFASSSGWGLVYIASPQAGEYLGSQDVWISVGTGLPAGAYRDQPMMAELGKAIVRQDGAWELVDDHRGQTAYDKQTRAKTVIAEIGELPATMTMLEPLSQFDVWDEPADAWVKDVAAEQQSLAAQAKQQKAALLAEATSMIAPLQDAVDMGIATTEDEVALLDWKRYRVELSRVDVAKHPVTWPVSPE